MICARPASERAPEVRAFGFVALALLGVALCTHVTLPLLATILWTTVIAIVVCPLRRVRRRGYRAVR